MTSLTPAITESGLCDQDQSPVNSSTDMKLFPSDRFWRRLTVWFVIVATAMLLVGLNYPLIDRTETRVAEISREILITGDWTTLHLNFQPYYDKPPLLYWLCAICFKVFGMNEFAARLIPALASLSTILCTVYFGSRWFGAKVGLLSGIVLFLSSGFVVLSRFLASDGLLALFTCLTAFSGYEAIRSLSYTGSVDVARMRIGNRWMMLCGAACGLGFLSKGPVIGVLCGIPFLFAILVLHRSQRFRWPAIGWAVLSFACIALPWIVWVAIHNPQYLSDFFLRHNIDRFGGEFHQKPFWYFIPLLLIGSHPWSFMTLPMLSQLFSRNRMKAIHSKPAIYLVITGLWCVLFFSLSRCKLPTYILPAAAPLSIATAVFLNAALSNTSHFRQKWLVQFVSPHMATWVTILGIIAYMFISPIGWSSTEIWMLGVAVVTVLTLAGGVASWLVRSKPYKSWIVCGAVSLGLSLWLSHCAIPSYALQTSCEGICSDGSGNNQIKPEQRVITLVEQFPDVPFYLHRNDILNYQHLDQACIEACVSNGTPTVLFIPTRVEAEFLSYKLLNSKKVVSNKRYAVYSFTPTSDQHPSIANQTVVSQKGSKY